MAEKKASKGKEHAYKTFENNLKQDQLGNLLLLCGKENYLIDWAIESITDKYTEKACRDFDFIKYNGMSTPFEEIRNSCETVPMLSSRKVVVADGLKCFDAETDDEQKWLSYAGQVPESCILILRAEKPDGRRKLYKSLSSMKCVYQFDELDETFLRKFIDKRLKAAGKTIKAAVAGELIAQSGYYDRNTEYTLYNLDNDLKKVISHASGEEIQREDVIKGISGNIERDVFFMIDAIGHGKKASAFKMLSNLALYSESEYKILGLICSQYEALLLVKEMKEDGRNPASISSTLGMHEYRVRLMLGLCEKYSLKQLETILQKAYQVDRNIKSGLLDKNLALELFTASV